jgi:hypothetical protein
MTHPDNSARQAAPARTVDDSTPHDALPPPPRADVFPAQIGRYRVVRMLG